MLISISVAEGVALGFTLLPFLIFLISGVYISWFEGFIFLKRLRNG